MINQVFNQDNIETMKMMPDEYLDGIITSPPYNVSAKRKDLYYNNGYSDIDNLSPEEYLEIRIKEFQEFDRIVKSKGVILYNLSYIHENPILPLQLINLVHEKTNLTVADVIYWKKSHSIPFQTSPTKLSRIIEPVYVIVHKDQLQTFKTNKKISKVNPKTNQKFYKNYTNIIEAKNNDGIKTKHKATFSTQLVKSLIEIYFPENSLIYDPFMGIGTTAKACLEKNCQFIGSEIKQEFYKETLSIWDTQDTTK